jgi:hypothetical protein
MDELFHGFRKIGVLVVSAAAVSCSAFTEPNRSSEEFHSSQRAKNPEGTEIQTNRNAPKEILMRFTIDEQGFAPDEQVKAQIKKFSMSGFRGWDQWSVWVGLDEAGTLKAMGLEEEKLKEHETLGGGRIDWNTWRISPSYRLTLTHDYAFPENTHISFKKVE